MVFLSVSVLSVGTVPAMATVECCHYAWDLVRIIHSKATAVCHCVHVCVCVRARGTFNLQWHFKLVCLSLCPVCVCGPRLTHLCCYRWSKSNVTVEWSAGRGIQVGMKERKRGTDRERQSMGVEEKHEVIEGTFTSAGSLTPPLLFSFAFHSFYPSLILSHSFSLSIISLPVAIPTTFSGVTQQKNEGDRLTVVGAVIWVFSHLHTHSHILKHICLLLSLWGHCWLHAFPNSSS